MNAPELPKSFERKETDLPTRCRVGGRVRSVEEGLGAPAGIGFITAVNNTYVGLWYVGTAFLFFILAGVLALIMRAQLAAPERSSATISTTSSSPCTAR